MSSSGNGLATYQMHIDGTWIDSSSSAVLESIDPTTGRSWANVPAGSADDVDRAVGAAGAALEGPWRDWTGTERARALRRLAELIERDADRLARLETRDNGKVLRETSGQVQSIPDILDYFAGYADKLLGSTIPTEKSNFFVYTVREPVGVVAAIVPWNSPLMLTVFKLAPALAAGCTVIVKPSEHTSATALELAGLVEQAGFPAGVVNVVTGLGKDVGRPLVAHRGVDKISFTGSSFTGSQIVQDSAPNVTRLTLELGGKSANIIFPDADLDAAIDGAVAGIFAAAGQTCIAGSRLLVHEDVRDDVIDGISRRAREIRLGDPSDMGTEMGPLAFEGQMNKVLEYFDIATSEGAQVVAGGRRVVDEPLKDGYFVEPTVVTGVDNSMRVAREEIFGPVLSVIPFRSDDEAVAIANDTDFGLAGGVWTTDFRRAHRVSSRIDAGTIWVNAYRTASPAVPFGGFKRSGIGYQNGVEGLDEFTRTKAVWVEVSGETRDPFRLG